MNTTIADSRKVVEAACDARQAHNFTHALVPIDDVRALLAHMDQQDRRIWMLEEALGWCPKLATKDVEHVG